MAAAVAVAFSDTRPELPPAYARLVQDGQYGKATLRALGAFGQDTPDPDDASTALKVLRALGFEQTARDIALSLLLRDRVS
jgi:hypothetical protein